MSLLVSSAQLRFAEPREHCVVGLLAHPTPVGFANPIEERGLSVACERLTVHLRYTVRYSIDSVNWSYFRPLDRITDRAVG